MMITDEMKQKLDLYLNDKDLKDKLSSDNIEKNKNAIQCIGLIAQESVDPLDVIKSYENNTMDSLYEYAKRLVELNKIYKQLCDDVYDYGKEQSKVVKELRK